MYGGECVARGLTMAGLTAETVSISVMDMDFSQEESDWISEPESLAQWQSRCQQVIQRDS